MIQKFMYFSLIILIILVTARLVFSQAKAPGVKGMTKAEKIDPMDPTAGDFLTQDQRELVRQAQDFYNKGDYFEAARGYLYALQFNPGDNISMYNLACCYGLMNKPELAAKYLRLALTSGFQNVNLALTDKDFESVKSSEVFKAVLDSVPQLVSQDSKTKGQMLFFDACAIFQCRIHLPQNYDKTKAYPLVVALHGYSDAADNFVENYSKFDNPQFIFAVPFAPYHFMIGNRIAYSWNLWMPGDVQFPGEDFNITEEYIINLINALKKYYSVSDVYLMGHSQGASTTYLVGIKHHELFKGLIPMAGPLNSGWLTDAELDAGKDLRMLIVHGKDDRSIYYQEGLASKRLMERHGYQTKFIDFEGGHEYAPVAVYRKIQTWIESGE